MSLRVVLTLVRKDSYGCCAAADVVTEKTIRMRADCARSVVVVDVVVVVVADDPRDDPVRTKRIHALSGMDFSADDLPSLNDLGVPAAVVAVDVGRNYSRSYCDVGVVVVGIDDYRRNRFPPVYTKTQPCDHYSVVNWKMKDD